MYDWQINITLRFSLWISSLFLFFGEAERLSEYGVTIVISKCFGVISWLYLPGKVLSIMPCCNVITGSQTALACVQQGFPHSFSLLPPAGSEKETGEASPCRNIHGHAKAWITLKRAVIHCTLLCVYVSVLSTPQYAQNIIQMLPHLSVWWERLHYVLSLSSPT